MKIINGTIDLVCPQKSGIKYRFIRFSDTQIQVQIDTDNDYASCDSVIIKSRMTWDSLQQIICVVKALRNLKVKNISLFVPYFLGARSDRQFEQGSTNYLKDVICPIINSLDFKEVIVVDPHSCKIHDYLKNVVDNENLYISFIEYVVQNEKPSMLIAPDDGASAKVIRIANMFSTEYVVCSKEINPISGEVIQFYVPEIDFKKNDVLLIDDICDGGKTFVELSKILTKRNVGNMSLVVTHGIFSKGTDELFTYFGRIYTTDSVRNQEGKVSVFNYF